MKPSKGLLMKTLFGLFLLLLSSPGVEAVPPPEKVVYRSNGDTLTGFLYRPAGKEPFPALILVHGDFGLTDWVKAQARRLAERGYVTLAVDLYRGDVPTDL